MNWYRLIYSSSYSARASSYGANITHRAPRPNETGKLEPCGVRNIGRAGSRYHREKKLNIKDSE